MRELTLAMSMSLDGFISGPKGEIDWVFSGDQVAIASKIEKLWDAGLHIMGSGAFGMATFWPTASTPFAPPMNQIPKTVFSKQGPAVLQAAAEALEKARQAGPLQPGAESWAQATVAGGDLADEIARLKAVDGKRIIAHGGARFARSLIAANLVDEYAVMIYPIILGKGVSIFSELPAPRPLKLVSSQAFPLGGVAQTYRPA